MFNYEQSEVDSLGYADGRGYQIKIRNSDKDRETKWLRANHTQRMRIGDILAEGSEGADTPERDVHIRHAQMFANLLYSMNIRGDGTNKAVNQYAWENTDSDGHAITAYAHVRAAMRWAIQHVIPEYVDDVMETLLDSGESVQYCVEFVENLHRHRFTVAEAAQRRGCWLEGSRGWRAIGELVNIAATHGMPLTDDDRTIIDAYLVGERAEVTLSDGTVKTPNDVGEAVDELSKDAHDWLNTHVAPVDWSFEWQDGEFFFWSDEDWEAEAE